MRNFPLILGLLLPALALAAPAKSKKRKPANNDSVHVIQMDPDVPVEKLEGPGITVHKLEDQELNSGPAPNLRDALLTEVGLEPYTRAWDHFEKDMLMQRLMNQSVEDVAKRYSALPRESLGKLKKLLAAMKENNG